MQTTFGDKSKYLTRKKNPRGNTFKDSSEGISWAEGGRCTADGLLNQQLHRLNTHESQLLYSVSSRTHLTERETDRERETQSENRLTHPGKGDHVGTRWQRSLRIRMMITHACSPLALAFLIQ